LSGKIKICHVSSVHLSFDTRIFYRYCKTLSALYAVTLIACHPRNETVEGIDIKAFPRYKNRFFRVFMSWLLLIPKSLKINAKIYHLHDPELIPLGLVLKLFGKKVIYDIHENIAEDIFDKDWIKNKQFWHRTYTLFEKPALRLFEIILAEDSYLKRYKSFHKNISVVHNYCDIGFFDHYKVTENRNVQHLFYIGVLFENRGILQILEAIYLLKKRGKTYYFHCVGELYTPLAEAITNLPFYGEIREQIIFYGRKNLEDGYAISKKCGIGLCIIHRMSNSIESYPTKLFEYMAIGLPSITSDFPLYKTVVEENECGITVNPLDVLALANGIERMSLEKEQYEKMVKHGFSTVLEKYNWSNERQKVFEVYHKLLS